ncbi:hypothetical protein [Sulfitobacter alexandrii]|uniref:hypothetical protein n=1 Tax=Sulfitobacter alexandrii TaxID=1917485 RepID=UPI0012EBB628|nr:hypothetical protein [Sulfitobacter alexandrii]
MRSDWILDVLADLKAYAASSNLTALAEQLDDAAILALAEISALEERAQERLHGQDETDGFHSGGTGVR